MSDQSNQQAILSDRTKWEQELDDLELKHNITNDPTKQQQIKKHQATIKSKLGRALLYLHDYEEARKLLTETSKNHQCFGNRLLAISDLIQLAKAELLLGNIRSIVPICERAYGLMEAEDSTNENSDEFVRLRSMIDIISQASSQLPPSG